jgi:purine-binding chemotaxis protein CheW
MSASNASVEESSPSGLGDAEIEILRTRAARYARGVEQIVEHVADVVIFARGDLRYAVPLPSLREIRPLRAACRIPGASPAVPGVFHYRGEILSLHDIEAFLGGASPRPAPWVLIVEHERERLGLMADEVIGVEPARASALRPVPVTLGDAGGCFQGVLDAGVVMLGPARLFANQQFFSAF